MTPRLAACALAAMASLLAAASAAATEADWDGALTLVAQRGPDYLGARRQGTSLRPGIFVRWGRVTLSSGGSWASPRQDDDIRGLGVELARTRELRVSLGLRMDSGRNESSSPALAGMGDVKRTVRARVSARWELLPKWELRAAWTIDAFARGGGNLGEARLQREWDLTPDLHLTAGASVTLAGDRYLQTYHGVTAEQSARSGYPVFTPRMSLRDGTVYSQLRLDLSDDWVAQAGIGWTRVLGDAARSPLTQRRSATSLSAGIGWRF